MSFMKSLTRLLVVNKDSLPKLEWLSSGEFFIPIYFDDILEEILSEFADDERDNLRTLAEMFTEHYHLDYHDKFLKLKQKFSHFDPDREAFWLKEYPEENLEEKRLSVIQGIKDFLEVCNYTELNAQNLNLLLEAPYPGLLSISVDMEKLDFFHIYYRGVLKEEKEIKKFWILREKYPSITFKRVFIIARYKKEFESQIIIRIFRDVSIENLKVVIPEVRLNLPLLDKLKLSLTFSSTLVTAIAKIILAATFNFLLFIIMFITFILGCIRTFFGFLNARTKCLKTYSENLYHQSLAGNMAAINLLVEQAETQEVKEAFLAYSMLYLHKNDNLTSEKLAQKVKEWIQLKFGRSINFEVEDALKKLTQKELVGEFYDDKKIPYFKVYDLPSALRRLDEIWDNHHLENNNGNPEEDQLSS